MLDEAGLGTILSITNGNLPSIAARRRESPQPVKSISTESIEEATREEVSAERMDWTAQSQLRRWP